MRPYVIHVVVPSSCLTSKLSKSTRPAVTSRRPLRSASGPGSSRIE